MEKSAFLRALVITTVLQCAMVLLGLLWPVLPQENLYPIVGTLLAILAGFLFARWVPGRTIAPAVVGGACAGAISSAAGALLAVLTGQGGPGPIVTALIATLTGLVAGVAGGFFGRLFGPQSAGSRSRKSPSR